MRPLTRFWPVFVVATLGITFIGMRAFIEPGREEQPKPAPQFYEVSRPKPDERAPDVKPPAPDRPRERSARQRPPVAEDAPVSRVTSPPQAIHPIAQLEISSEPLQAQEAAPRAPTAVHAQAPQPSAPPVPQTAPERVAPTAREQVPQPAAAARAAQTPPVLQSPAPVLHPVPEIASEYSRPEPARQSGANQNLPADEPFPQSGAPSQSADAAQSNARALSDAAPERFDQLAIAIEDLPRAAERTLKGAMLTIEIQPAAGTTRDRYLENLGAQKITDAQLWDTRIIARFELSGQVYVFRLSDGGRVLLPPAVLARILVELEKETKGAPLYRGRIRLGPFGDVTVKEVEVL